MLNKDALEKLLANENVQKFLGLLRWCEGTDGPDGYRTLFGGSVFDDYSHHPHQVVTAKLGSSRIASSAAGAYQFLSKTWDRLVELYALQDFSPESQDIACLALIDGRKALDDVVAGRWEVAIAKCNREWASLPGSPYGQPTKTMPKCLAHLGAAPMVAPIEIQPTVEKNPMAPFVWPAVSMLMESIPSLIKLFGKGEQSAKNAETAQKVLDIAMPLVDASNAQDLVEKVQSDPEARALVAKGVEDNWFALVGEAGGGGIEGARKYDKSVNPMGKPWLSPAVWMSVLLIPLAYMVVGAVLWGEGWTNDIKAMVVGSIISLVIGSITGFFLGTSYNSQRRADLKDDK